MGIVFLWPLHQLTNAIAEPVPGEEKERESDFLPNTVPQASDDLFAYHGSGSGTGFGQWSQCWIWAHPIPQVPSGVLLHCV